MGSVFKFKQFEVDQEGCAMRINTDGVMLAAMAVQEQPNYILDIGTGTGVIALMMAQRFPLAKITAVEIDEAAARRAAGNFRSSAFADRLQVVHQAIEDYESDIKYDLIITNPPFFVNDLKNAEDRKSLARHASTHFFEALILKTATLLSESGMLWLILPVKQADELIIRAEKEGFVLNEEISVCSDIHKPVIRKIIALGCKTATLRQKRFYIYEAEGVYTVAYKQLLKDFFLAF